jgi:hypothetical protein
MEYKFFCFCPPGRGFLFVVVGFWLVGFYFMFRQCKKIYKLLALNFTPPSLSLIPNSSFLTPHAFRLKPQTFIISISLRRTGQFSNSHRWVPIP